MAEAGFDLSGQYAKSVKKYLGVMECRYLIIVCDKADKKCPRIFPGVLQRLYWPFEDPAAFQGPAEQKLAKFREVRDQIEARIKLWLREIA